jgi:drug/metabolite transporter (DMT)-like permease
MRFSKVQLAYMVLGFGLFGATFGAPFIRLTQEAGMPTVVIIAGRLTLITLIYAPFVLARGGIGQIQALSWREWLFLIVAGVLLVGHFLTFISALEYTSVMGTLVFSSLSPLFAAGLSWVILREKVTRPVLIGIGLALAGTVLYAVGGSSGGNPPTRDAPLLGNTLAAFAGVFLASYFTVGRYARGKLDGLTYSWLVFGFAAIAAWVVLSIMGITVLGYSREAYLWLLMVTLFAQIIAHSSWNYALGALSTPVVSMVILLMPVTSTVVSIFLLNELPSSWMSVAGSLVILAGVGFGNLTQNR